MIESDTDWVPRLKVLVERLVTAGSLRGGEWIKAFSQVPRHVFVPDILVPDADGYRPLPTAEPAQRAEWLSAAYSDDSLVVQVRPHPAGYRVPSGAPLLVPTSSSTMPSLMARMLDALDLRDGHRVLEIGTGTGYNAALLCHRLGADSVVSIDIDPELVSSARERLARLSYRPALITGDGTAGVASGGPYDRVIATAAVSEVPLAWIEQLAPGGKILANIRGELAGGTLCLLTKHDDDEVIGPILPIGGHFMWARADRNDPRPPLAPGNSSRSTTRLDLADLVNNDDFRFLVQLQVFGALSVFRESGGTVVTATDGSRAETAADREPDGSWRVVQSGPRRLWDTVEATARLWDRLGQPGPDRFGIVANRSTQFVWFGDDEGWYRWPLPLR